MKKTAEVINNFAFKTAGLIGDSTDEDFFFSPFSVISAFGMVYAGSSGQTASEIERALSFNSEIHSTLGELIKELSKNSFISSANRIWLCDGINLKNEFSNILSNDYFSDSQRLDFKNDSEKARDIINKWVSQNTNDRIKNLLQRIEPETQMILTNAVYFNAKWAEPFDKNITMFKPFKVPNVRRPFNVPMMRQNKEFFYSENNGTKIVRLPYDNRIISMIVVLPPENNMNSFKNLNQTIFSQWLKSLSRYRVDLWLPKFKSENRYELKEIFNAIGIKSAFENYADFSKITDDEKLKLDSVVHQTFIEVDEEKTEAAAATSIGMVRATALPPTLPRAVFHADRPFIYFIIDNNSGTILFIGRQTFK